MFDFKNICWAVVIGLALLVIQGKLAEDDEKWAKMQNEQPVKTTKF